MNLKILAEPCCRSWKVIKFGMSKKWIWIWNEWDINIISFDIFKLDPRTWNQFSSLLPLLFVKQVGYIPLHNVMKEVYNKFELLLIHFYVFIAQIVSYKNPWLHSVIPERWSAKMQILFELYCRKFRFNEVRLLKKLIRTYNEEIMTLWSFA